VNTNLYIQKRPTPPLSIRRINERTKTKVLILNKYMAMGPSGARCQVWACRLVADSKLLLLLLQCMCSQQMPQTSSKKTLDTFTWPPPSAITFPKEAKLQLCRNPLRTRNSIKLHVQLASCLQLASYSRKLFWKYPKGTLKREACLMQASFVSVPVREWHCDVWGLWTTWP
jgi:hypothetical protein